jgi:hypothetical protein
MILELTYEERLLLIESIYARLKMIDRLVRNFQDPDLIKIYTKDEGKLMELRIKLYDSI